MINYFGEIVENNRLFRLLVSSVKSSACYDDQLFVTLVSYFNRYLEVKKLDAQYAEQCYESYIEEYNRDLKLFEKTRKYPLALDPERKPPSRSNYNIILLISTLLSFHRFRIMQLIAEKSVAGNAALFVGCGPGIEIELVRQKYRSITAFDVLFDTDLQALHGDVVFKAEYFRGKESNTYSSVYLIEILEHLNDPYDLLEKTYHSLENGGHLLLTIATDVPQFDHVYNFEADHERFEAAVKKIGFKIQFAENIKHRYLSFGDVDAMNRFYVLMKQPAKL